MLVWLDEQLSPALVGWFRSRLDVSAAHVRDLGFARAKDREIFAAAREAAAVVLTKDADFPELVRRLGPPPQVIWLTLGNTSTAALSAVLATRWASITSALAKGEPIVELTGR